MFFYHLSNNGDVIIKQFVAALEFVMLLIF